MIIKALAFSGGLVGAAGLSQYPEFTQQYTQRLAGQVDALTQVVADFEASALRSNLTRTQALAQMTGTEFLEARRDDMTRTFARHAALSEHLTVLRNATGLQRLSMPHRVLDQATVTQTFGDYSPALPLTFAGAISGAVGFVLGWGFISLVLAILRWPFRRRRIAA